MSKPPAAWRQKFGTLGPADVKRLRVLEAESSRLKRMLAERGISLASVSLLLEFLMFILLSQVNGGDPVIDGP